MNEHESDQTTLKPGPYSSQSIASFCNQTASKQPTPGGGSVGAVVAAHAISLLEMVFAYSVNRKAVIAHKETLAQSLEELAQLRSTVLKLADEDAAAYGLLNSLMRDNNTADEELRSAALRSTNVPLRLSAVCDTALRIARKDSEHLNPYLHSDLLIGADLLCSVCRSAEHLVLANKDQLQALGAWDTQGTSAADARSRAEASFEWLSQPYTDS